MKFLGGRNSLQTHTLESGGFGRGLSLTPSLIVVDGNAPRNSKKETPESTVTSRRENTHYLPRVKVGIVLSPVQSTQQAHPRTGNAAHSILTTSYRAFVLQI